METNKGKKGQSKINVGTIFTFCILAFFAVIFTFALSLDAAAGQVPRLISGIGLVLTIIEFITQVRSFGKKVEKDEKDDNEKAVVGKKWYYVLIIAVAYVCSLVILGFILSTLILLIATPIYLGYRKIKVITIFSVSATAILYASFTYLFSVTLTEGLVFTVLLGR